MSNPLARVKLGLDAADYFRGMERVVSEAQRGSTQLSAAVAKAGKLTAGLGLGTAAAVLVASTRSAADYADGMGKLAQRAGVTSEAISGLAFAAKLADVDNQELARGLRALGEEAEKGGAKFKALGISLQDASGRAKTSDQLLRDVANVFAAMPDGIQKTNLAIDLFGAKLGPQLIPLLNGAAAGLEKAAEEAQRFGLVVSDRAVKSAESFNDNLTRLRASAEGLKISIGNAALPTLLRFTDELLVGAQVAGGFAAALFLIGTSRTFENASAGAKFYREELGRLTTQRDRLIQQEGVLANTSGFDRQIDKAKQLLTYYDQLNRIDFARNFTINTTTAENDPRRGRGYREPEAPPIPRSPDTVAALQARIRELRELRDNAAVGSEEFRRYGAELARFEARLQALTGTARQSAGAVRDPEASARSYLEGLQRQLQAMENLSVAETVLRDAQAGRLGVVNPARLQEIVDVAKQIDQAKALADAEKERWEIIEQRRAAVAAEGDAVERANESWRSLVESLTYNTSESKTKRLIAQVKALDEALILGVINAKEHEEAFSHLNGGTVQLLKQRTAAEELGMSFTSAFEDAIVSGRKFSDVLKGLEQDILRIITRRLVTEPLANAATSWLGSIFGGFPSFDGGGFTGYGGRSGGLDGKGGYMAMLHPNETVVDHTKGQRTGGAAPIVVNVTMPQGASRATGTQFGDAIARRLQLANSRNG
jgi:hypothetical protein